MFNLDDIPNTSTSVVSRFDEFLLADIQINRHLREQSDDDRLLHATATKSFFLSRVRRNESLSKNKNKRPRSPNVWQEAAEFLSLSATARNKL